ncbi:MAG: glycoside hydrolase family 1 [Opitutus sp.]|nr:glycoside hydrolase family 1 [Opitutus sp.]
MAEPHRIIRAWLESPNSGIIELDRDWAGRARPRFTLGKHCPTPGALAPASGLAAGRAFGYYLNQPTGAISFVLPLEHGCDIDALLDTVYLAGDFNGWQAAVGKEEWKLLPAELEGEQVLQWTGVAEDFRGWGQRFKFVTGEQQWLVPPADAPNAVRDNQGNVNRLIDPARTGSHLWRFSLIEPLSLAEAWTAGWAEASAGSKQAGESVPLVPGNFFYELKSSLPLGAMVQGEQTLFRIFAPRARSVTLYVAHEKSADWNQVAPATKKKVEKPQDDGSPIQRSAFDAALPFPLARRDDADGVAGVWELALDRSLHGWYYWYSIDGPREGPGPNGFDPQMRILDPYALATVGRGGPGIVLDRAWVGQVDDGFQTPAWHDLVIAEAHVRDLATNAPVKAGADERLGFSGLRQWVESDDFYLHHLGVNCVELQPVHEFDNVTVDEYHWGYMTNNFFAPESSYALDPDKASGVRELQELVVAFHGRGMAVVLDVVFNHVGVPAHLMFIDKLYYFEVDAGGALANWSGCGNDLRARSAMARRLIIDSCLHFIEAYGVDGFRFDLAELLGVDVLRDIEVALKDVKPDVILIAEPWSFRGHIAGALRVTGWASWNDGYRDFVRDYVRGNGEPARMEYFLRGSPWYFAKWPAQTINYTESHDDRTWIDMITENGSHNGQIPSANDRRRTHLMAALLFMSLGIPMISAGQDFLRSKHGVLNTYLRGDLNALDYRRLHRYLGTHAYFADWIAFRRGEFGQLLRQGARPSEGFFQFIPAPGSPAMVVVYNADFSQGPARLLFAINPSTTDLTIPLGAEIVALSPSTWEMLADQDRFYLSDAHGARRPVDAQMWLPALSCGLWVSPE